MNGGRSRCWLTGATWGPGNKVSHSNRKHHRKFRKNIQSISLTSDCLNKTIKKPIAVATLRTVMKHGSLDLYLASRRAAQLTRKAVTMRNAIRKKMGDVPVRRRRIQKESAAS